MENSITTSDAPAETGVDDQADTNLSVQDLAASFMEKVEDEQKESATDATEGSTETEVVESEEEESNVLSNSKSNDTETEVEDSDDDSDEVSEEENEPEEGSKGLNRALARIGKLTKRAKSAEEALEQAREQIESLKTNTPEGEGKPNSPALEEVNTFEDLDRMRKEAISAKRWALSHVGKEWVEFQGQEYQDADIRNILDSAEHFLSEKLPERQKYLQEKQAWADDTATVFPWIAEEDGSNYEKFIQVRQSPQYKEVLDNLPNGDFVAGVLVKGITAIEAEQKAIKPKAKQKSPPPSDIGDAVAPPNESREVRQEKRKKEILGTGNISVEKFAQYLT